MVMSASTLKPAVHVALSSRNCEQNLSSNSKQNLLKKTSSASAGQRLDLEDSRELHKVSIFSGVDRSFPGSICFVSRSDTQTHVMWTWFSKNVALMCAEKNPISCNPPSCVYRAVFALSRHICLLCLCRTLPRSSCLVTRKSWMKTTSARS